MKPRKNQSGMTMVEVLVTMLIVSFGLLGAGALQLMSLQVNQGANQRSQAAMLATSVIDSMKGNRARAPEYARGYGSAIPSETNTNVPLSDIASITRQVRSVLPGGDIQIRVVAVPTVTNPVKLFYNVTVTVRWSESGRLLDRNSASPPVFTEYQLQSNV